MSDRDDLALLLFQNPVTNGAAQTAPEIAALCEAAAAAILATGYRKPHIVAEAEELSSLPQGTVILDSSGRLLKAKTGTKGIPGWKYLEPLDGIEASFILDGASVSFPATVLHKPAATQ